MDLKKMSLEEIIEKIKSEKISREEVYEYFLKRIEKYNDETQAFNVINKENISDVEGILAGIPIGVKALYCEDGIESNASSRQLQDFVPNYTSTVIENLNKEGMSSIGKVVMDEFAMGTTNENAYGKNARNPWALDRIPGGTSWGSASSVASGLVPAAIGSDTGGSLRQPACMCWVVGFKPSYGRNSRYGVDPMASSFDTPGTITRTVKDAGILYEIMNGEDKLDSTTIEGKHILDEKIWETQNLKGKKIGILKEFFDEGLDEGVKQTILASIEKMKELGAEVQEFSLPVLKYALATYYIIVPAEVSTNMARYDGIRYGHVSDKANADLEEMYRHNRWEGLGEEVKRRIMVGSYVLSAGYYDAYYKKASQVRTLLIQELEKVFEEVDAIIGPVSPSVAWKLGEKTDDPLKMYLADIYTVPFSLAGLPGMSVPCGFTQSEDEEKIELPVWLQIIGGYKQEENVFEIGNVWQKHTDYHTKFPQKFEA